MPGEATGSAQTKRLKRCKYLLPLTTLTADTTAVDVPTKLLADRYGEYMVPVGLDNPNASKVVLLDPWPAYMKMRGQSREEVLLTREKRLIYRSEQDSKLSPMFKPRLLEKIDNDIHSKRVRHKLDDNDTSPLTFHIYQDAFSEFIQHSSYFAPLLSRIKQEYERQINQLKESLQTFQPLRECLCHLSLVTEEKIMQVCREKSSAISGEGQRIKALKQELHKFKEDRLEKDTIIAKLTKDLANTSLKLQKEVDVNNLLVTENNQKKNRLKELEEAMRAENADDTGDPVLLKISLKQAGSQILKLQKMLAESEFVAHKAIEEDKFNDLNKNIAQLEQTNEELEGQIEEITLVRDALQDDVELLRLQKDLSLACLSNMLKGVSSHRLDTIAVATNRLMKKINEGNMAVLKQLNPDEIYNRWDPKEYKHRQSTI